MHPIVCPHDCPSVWALELEKLHASRIGRIRFLNTSLTETPASLKRESRPTMMIHPMDAATAGIFEGVSVTLGNRRGSITLIGKLFDGMQRGVVVVESVWPNRYGLVRRHAAAFFARVGLAQQPHRPDRRGDDHPAFRVGGEP